MLFGTGEGVATTTPLRIWWSTLHILLFQSQSIGIFAINPQMSIVAT
jgi:hypothetical protein